MGMLLWQAVQGSLSAGIQESFAVQCGLLFAKYSLLDAVKRATCLCHVHVCNYCRMHQRCSSSCNKGPHKSRVYRPLAWLAHLPPGLASNQAASSGVRASLQLFLGDTNRTISETPLNQASSRSHCIFTVVIEGRRPGEPTVRRSKLNLVDLAGSERVSRTGIDGGILKEARYINLSLHYLEQVIIALQVSPATKLQTCCLLITLTVAMTLTVNVEMSSYVLPLLP